jgi:hypothetical protein
MTASHDFSRDKKIRKIDSDLAKFRKELIKLEEKMSDMQKKSQKLRKRITDAEKVREKRIHDLEKKAGLR